MADPNDLSQLTQNNPDLSGMDTSAPSQPMAPPPQDNRGMLKQLLSSFFVGGGSAMMKSVGLETPEEQQQRQFSNQLAVKRQTSLDQERQSIQDTRDFMNQMKEQQQQFTQSQLAPSLVNDDMADMLGVPRGSKLTPKQIQDALPKVLTARTTGQFGLEKQGMINAEKSKEFDEKIDQFHQTLDYKKWKAQLDNDTKLRVGQMNASKAPAALLQVATFANSGLHMMDDARAAFKDLKDQGVLGSIPENKIEDALFGAGYTDPSWTADQNKKMGVLRAALGYTTSTTMRVHTGRTSQEIFRDFKTRLGLGQNSDALYGALDETQKLLTGYANSASNEAINALRNPGGAIGGQPKATHRWNSTTNKIEVIPSGK